MSPLRLTGQPAELGPPRRYQDREFALHHPDPATLATPSTAARKLDAVDIEDVAQGRATLYLDSAAAGA